MEKSQIGAPFWAISKKTIAKKQTNVFAGKMYPTVCVEWAEDHFGLGLS